MKNLDLLDLLLVLSLDPLYLDHASQLRLLDLHPHLLDLVFEPEHAHRLDLFLLALRESDPLLKLLAFDLPLEQLLGLVEEESLDLKLHLLHVRVAL